MTKAYKWATASAAALLIATTAHADVAVDGAWVRATVPQQNGTGAFMQLTSQTDSTLVKADSPVAKHVEVHEMVVENHVMKMRQVPGVKLPAGQTVELKPGGYHIMLIDLHGQVKEGESVPLTLTFEDASGKTSTLEVDAPVRALATSAHGGHGHGAHGAASQGGSAHGAATHGHTPKH